MEEYVIFPLIQEHKEHQHIIDKVSIVQVYLLTLPDIDKKLDWHELDSSYSFERPAEACFISVCS